MSETGTVRPRVRAGRLDQNRRPPSNIAPKLSPFVGRKSLECYLFADSAWRPPSTSRSSGACPWTTPCVHGAPASRLTSEVKIHRSQARIRRLADKSVGIGFTPEAKPWNLRPPSGHREPMPIHRCSEAGRPCSRLHSGTRQGERGKAPRLLERGAIATRSLYFQSPESGLQ